jgi:hypothetical protein
MSESGEINEVKEKAALGGLKVSFSSDTSDDDGVARIVGVVAMMVAIVAMMIAVVAIKIRVPPYWWISSSGRTILSRCYRGSAQQQGRR